MLSRISAADQPAPLVSLCSMRPNPPLRFPSRFNLQYYAGTDHTHTHRFLWLCLCAGYLCLPEIAFVFRRPCHNHISSSSSRPLSALEILLSPFPRRQEHAPPLTRRGRPRGRACGHHEKGGGQWGRQRVGALSTFQCHVIHVTKIKRGNGAGVGLRGNEERGGVPDPVCFGGKGVGTTRWRGGMGGTRG